ncbi:aldehyde dehydrogenase family protein [Spongiibacter sp. KMU-166]|uniref:Aldehyde dehydrogenase family protein n=1 Tax=Spongiibacter thalassae TaxID=2721624 RepID=A0ABX1GHH3_9GAMM|nr:aldehyde dehydrogenase family protein [Spongiibacter thalassae]
MPREMRHFIEGREVESADGRRGELLSPVDEAVFATYAFGGEEDVDKAVSSARAQFDHGEWSRLSGYDRGLLLNKLADLIERDADLIAEMDAACIGRPAMEPRILDLPNAIQTIRTSAGWADKLEGRTIPTPGYLGRPTISYTVHEAVGVVAAITPWNTPFMITCWKVGPLLAAGCTVVIKPSEETPMSALHLARLVKEAGFPDGVVNVVTGSGSVIGNALVRNPGVDKVTFTGSPGVGKHIQQEAAEDFKRVSLELGGKSPQIVYADADLAEAVAGCAMGIFFNQGQICAAGSRILVHEDIAEIFAQQFAAVAESIVVGDPAQEGVQMGPVAKKAQFDRVNDYIRKGIDAGATLMAGGVSEYTQGWFVKPTVFANANNDMVIAQEEIFGPVATIIPFKDEDEAIQIANGTVYGLGATVWTSDVKRAHRLAKRVKAGAVGVNCWAPIDARLPWGGVKQSGIGRECGLAGVMAYTEEKVITVVTD